MATCSTSKLATTSQNDDVYNSVAKAREVEIIPQQQYAQNQNQDQGQDQDGYDEYYGTSNPYYDMDYSSRINRFSNGTSWRGYYDPYYDNFSYGNSYGATNYLGYGGLGWSSGYGLGGWGGGFGLGFGYGSMWNNPFYYVTWALDGTTLVGITGDHILITIASVGAAVVSAEAGAMAADSTVVAFTQETITTEQDQETR